MIFLRPHHILCIQQFKGYGYNEEFIKNMFNILHKIKKEQVFIKTNFDDICKKCPNLLNNVCILDSEIMLLDNRVLSILNLDLNKPLDLNKIFITKEDFINICSPCSWYKKGFCKYENFWIKEGNKND